MGLWTISDSVVFYTFLSMHIQQNEVIIKLEHDLQQFCFDVLMKLKVVTLLMLHENKTTDTLRQQDPYLEYSARFRTNEALY